MSSEIIWKYEKPNYEILLEKLEKLQKENEELKDDKEGLINGYKGTADKLEELRAKYNELQKENTELEKTIDLIIDDFQIENYFVGMTNKEVREHYKKRKELEE